MVFPLSASFFMPRYALLIEYDGSRFCGFQRQLNQPSVQQFLEDMIEIFVKHPVVIHVSGRTDTGVHAFGQVVHFDSPEPIDLRKLRAYLNHFGSRQGVCILDIHVVPNDFHARFSSLERSYLYLILNRSSPSPLMEGRATYVRTLLDVDRMQQAASKLLGYHNFESFRSRHCQSKQVFRTLDECSVVRQGHLVTVHLRSRSFLHNQVRISVGTLIQIGMKRKDPTWIDDLLAIQDRTKAGPTAPAHGLYFKGVKYKQDIFGTDRANDLHPFFFEADFL